MRLSSFIILLSVCVVAGCDVSGLDRLSPGDADEAIGPAEAVANAGADLVVLEGTRVMLAGNASRALAGEPALAWSQREGPAVVLSNPSSSSPVFVAPLSPARLVFALEATTESRRDVDTVVVDVVDHASLLPSSPATASLGGDRVVTVGQPFELDEPWTGRGDAVVGFRCNRDSGVAPAVANGRLTLSIVPLALPCTIVVDDLVADGAPGAGRAAITLWPADTTVVPVTRATVRAPAADTDGPLFLEPGEVVELDVDVGTRVFFGDGRAIQLATDPQAPTRMSFTAPSSPGRLLLFAEARDGGVSGGLQSIVLDVRAGVDNVAPVVDAGSDLRVRPGARFRIVPDVVDDDDDDVTIAVTQVLGETVQLLGGGVGTLQAPTTAQTLLFHVVASDGTVDSAPDPVRVVVDAAAENQPPILTVPATLHVVPGGTFVVDASSARDPDNGLIASTRIAQEGGDVVRILDAAVDALSVTLTAGAAGDVYRFVISAIDDGGLETSATLTVIVEDAGPWVDATRAGSAANGTIDRPFATIAAALDTAARHRFATLLLAGSPLVLEALPDGLGLVGGHVFEAGNYVDGSAPTQVTVAGGVDVAGASLEGIGITGTGSVRLRRHVVLRDVGVGVPLAALAGANVEVFNSSVVDVDVDGATIAFDDVDIVGQVRGQGATIGVRGGTITASRAPAVQVTGGALTTADVAIDGVGVGLQVVGGAIASLGGDVVVVGEIDGQGGAAVGVKVDGGRVDFAELDLRVHGGERGTGVLVGAGAAIGGALDVTVEDVVTAVGLDSRAAVLGGTISGRVSARASLSATGVVIADGILQRLRVVVVGPSAVGIAGPRVDARAVLVVVTGADSAVGTAVDAGTLRHVTVIADDTAVVGGPGLALRNVVLRAPVGVVGAVEFGVVGIAAAEPAGCPGCIVGAVAAVDVDTGELASDAVLGGPNPFVDVGLTVDAVSVDLEGRTVPAGAGPDLGALERD